MVDAILYLYIRTYQQKFCQTKPQGINIIALKRRAGDTPNLRQCLRFMYQIYFFVYDYICILLIYHTNRMKIIIIIG